MDRRSSEEPMRFPNFQRSTLNAQFRKLNVPRWALGVGRWAFALLWLACTSAAFPAAKLSLIKSAGAIWPAPASYTRPGIQEAHTQTAHCLFIHTTQPQ